MKTASVTQSKNGLSGLLRHVRSGHSVLIMDRNVPVAVLAPVTAASLPADARLMALERQGLLRRPRRSGSVHARLAGMPLPKLAKGASAVAAVLADRGDDR
jgi:prevent-host-death family protein